MADQKEQMQGQQLPGDVADLLQRERQRILEAARRVLLGNPYSLVEALAEIERACEEQ